jgi:hypothetical protein
VKVYQREEGDKKRTWTTERMEVVTEVQKGVWTDGADGKGGEKRKKRKKEKRAFWT